MLPSSLSKKAFFSRCLSGFLGGILLITSLSVHHLPLSYAQTQIESTVTEPSTLQPPLLNPISGFSNGLSQPLGLTVAPGPLPSWQYVFEVSFDPGFSQVDFASAPVNTLTYTFHFPESAFNRRAYYRAAIRDSFTTAQSGYSPVISNIIGRDSGGGGGGGGILPSSFASSSAFSSLTSSSSHISSLPTSGGGGFVSSTSSNSISPSTSRSISSGTRSSVPANSLPPLSSSPKASSVSLPISSTISLSSRSASVGSLPTSLGVSSGTVVSNPPGSSVGIVSSGQSNSTSEGRDSSLANSSARSSVSSMPPQCRADTDRDNDGLSDCLEDQHQTDPILPDTDGDGFGDGDEVLFFGTDPLDPLSNPQTAHAFAITNLRENDILPPDPLWLVQGVCVPGSRVRIRLTNRQDGTVRVIAVAICTPERQFVTTVRESVPNGSYLIVAERLDDAGQVVESTPPIAILVDAGLAVSPPRPDGIGGAPVSDPLPQLAAEVRVVAAQPMVTGTTERGCEVQATFQSLITSSAILSDSETGRFRLQSPSPLGLGEHRVFLTAVCDGNRRSRTIVIPFTIVPDMLVFLGWPWWVWLILLLLITSLLTYWRYRQLRKKRDLPPSTPPAEPAEDVPVAEKTLIIE